ncbi:radical SAM protein [Magnetospirillum sp. SS-4]|uniref:radical SAM protein n=1 Tax=Magnetospirillum sp. SS-4 TaxID=2681465 RepID=UPI00137DF872|nr:radical SAM protein [Magnetospirillum sp. SS-4]CAA7619637.1 hypothetical protein MTBSS4_250033 [Magnetospirillum sp. SS-4]
MMTFKLARTVESKRGIMPKEFSSHQDLWRLHPQGEFLLARGGEKIPPPPYLNLSLSYACNLLCKICPSQNWLQLGRTPRRYMSKETLQNVIDVVLPFTTEIALNSWGEPLIYPYFEDILLAIRQHKCKLFVQTNATRLDDRKIALLCETYGTVSMSIDATGTLFEELRRNGQWSDVDRGVRDLLARRDPSRLAVQISPTISSSNLDSVGDLLLWAHEVGIDFANIRLYQAFTFGTEAVVSKEQLAAAMAPVLKQLGAINSRMRVYLSDEVVYPGQLPQHRPPPGPKGAATLSHFLYPVSKDHAAAHPDNLCCAPHMGLDIGVDGQMTVCCWSQMTPFDMLGTVENFADFWFGNNIKALRASLRHESTARLAQPACAICIQTATGQTRAAVAYAHGTPDGDDGMVFDRDPIPLSMILHVEGHAYRGTLPIGIRRSEYALVEDGTILSAGGAIEADTASQGRGLWGYADIDAGNTVHFSSSDNSNPLTNGRRYYLTRNP